MRTLKLTLKLWEYSLQKVKNIFHEYLPVNNDCLLNSLKRRYGHNSFIMDLTLAISLDIIGGDRGGDGGYIPSNI